MGDVDSEVFLGRVVCSFSLGHIFAVLLDSLLFDGLGDGVLAVFSGLL